MAKLSLERPLCFFDLEATGIRVAQDRIVEISILKIFPNGNKEAKTWRVNPEIPIPKETTAIHGICDEDVKNEPTFKELAPKVLEMIKGADLAGYNSNRFDIPMLAEEFMRAEVDFTITDHKAVDVQVIFHKMEPRNLSAAYRLYCDKELENAHSAAADTLATYEILEAQLERYDELKNEVNFLSRFSTQKKNADAAGMLGFDSEGNEIFLFGKYKGQNIAEVFEKDKGYYNWIQRSDFPLYTKKILTEIQLRKLSERFSS